MYRIPFSLALAFICIGCAASGPVSADSPLETDGLEAHLRARGYTLEVTGLSQQTLAPVAPSRQYRFQSLPGTNTLQVYEFESEEAASEGLVTLRAQIRARAGRLVFARGPLVVYYEGNNSGIRMALTDALGEARDV